jgi:hypothetical protein
MHVDLQMQMVKQPPMHMRENQRMRERETREGWTARKLEDEGVFMYAIKKCK